MTKSTMQFKWHDNILLVTALAEIRTSQFQNIFILRRPGVAKYADIFEITIMLINTNIKETMEVKKLE